MRRSPGLGLKLSGSLAAVLLGATAATMAPAAGLDQQACDQMKREIVQLEGLGARDNFNKGAAWGKANLRSAQLEQVKQLIEMDEAVAFRCPRSRPKLQPAAVAGEAKGKGKVVAKVLPKAPAVAAGKTPADQSKAKPKPKPAAEGGPAAGNAGTTASAPRPKAPAPKPVDAYSPPAKAPAAQ